MAWPVDAETLADRSGYPPINLGQHYTAALSPNGRLWAAITWPRSADYDGVLHLIDLITWEDVPTPVKFGKWVPQMAFSPDGSRLVVAEAFLAISSGVSRWDAGLKIINPDALEEVLTVDLDFFPGRIQFSADGRQLTVYGTPPPTRIDPHHLAANPPQVVAFDVLVGSRRWSLTLEEVKDGRYSEPTTDDPDRINYYSPGVAFSADGRWLYVVHADEDQLTAVDLAVGSARTVAITEPQSWLDRLIALTAGTAYAKGPRSGAEKWAVLSPDGKRLYVTGVQREWQPKQGKQGDGQVVETPLEMQVIDPHSGERLATAGIASADLAISPDGRWLYLQLWRQANSPGEA
ncbi:MAG: WD40 repeat domain-containing protein, partial [Anaerolineae bacterium]